MFVLSDLLFCSFSIPGFYGNRAIFKRRGRAGEKPGDEMQEWVRLFFSPDSSEGRGDGCPRSRCRSSGWTKGPCPAQPGGSAIAIGPAATFTCTEPRGPESKVRGAGPRRRRSAAQVRPSSRSGKMPLGQWIKKKAKSKESARLVEGEQVEGEQVGAGDGSLPATPVPPRSLVFYTQLAHGSATARVENFSNIRELYTKIAEVFEIPHSEVRARCSLSLSHRLPASPTRSAGRNWPRWLSGADLSLSLDTAGSPPGALQEK